MWKPTDDQTLLPWDPINSIPLSSSGPHQAAVAPVMFTDPQAGSAGGTVLAAKARWTPPHTHLHVPHCATLACWQMQGDMIRVFQ